MLTPIQTNPQSPLSLSLTLRGVPNSLLSATPNSKHRGYPHHKCLLTMLRLDWNMTPETDIFSEPELWPGLGPWKGQQIKQRWETGLGRVVHSHDCLVSSGKRQQTETDRGLPGRVAEPGVACGRHAAQCLQCRRSPLELWVHTVTLSSSSLQDVPAALFYTDRAEAGSNYRDL